MAAFTDSLRGYGLVVYQRDNFRCRYCGLDGRQSFERWLFLSLDHLLPKVYWFSVNWAPGGLE
jgi:molybdenum cofactor biosynthesis enzyme MoaA